MYGSYDHIIQVNSSRNFGTTRIFTEYGHQWNYSARGELFLRDITFDDVSYGYNSKGAFVKRTFTDPKQGHYTETRCNWYSKSDFKHRLYYATHYKKILDGIHQKNRCKLQKS